MSGDSLIPASGSPFDSGMNRIVSWFSCGAASAVATKLVLGEGHEDVHIVYTEPGSEHPDNKRFIRECEEWFGHEVEVLKTDKYEDTWDVWEKTRYLVGPSGARCTGELKKKLRYGYQRSDDIQVFGFTADKREVKRADRFRGGNFEVNLRTPLIERGLTKKDCLGLLDKAGIELPAMYLLGYQNNNCIGCPKGGMGYWNKIRRDFPETFQRMAELEQRIGATCLRESDPENPSQSRPLPLFVLDPNRGNHADEADIECGLLCTSVFESELGECPGDAA